jgi:hypothetical protein
MRTPTPSERCRAILNEIESIPVIVPGKVSARRQAGKVTGWKLQHWHGGRNETRHIPAPLVDLVKEGTKGHQRLVALTQELAEVRGREVLGPRTQSPSKKRPTTPS